MIKIKLLFFNAMNLLKRPFPKQWVQKAFWVLFLFGCILRIYSGFVETPLKRDSILYLQQSNEIAENGWSQWATIEKEQRPPFLIAMIAFGKKMGVSARKSGFALVMILGCLLPIVMYKIADLLFHSTEISLATMLLTCLHPTLISFSSKILRDGPYLFFSALSLLAFLYALKKGHWFYFFIFGCTLGGALFQRFEALELFLLPLGWMIYVVVKHEKWMQPSSAIIGGCGFAIVSFCLLVRLPISIFSAMYLRCFIHAVNEII